MKRVGAGTHAAVFTLTVFPSFQTLQAKARRLDLSSSLMASFMLWLT